MGLRTSYIQLYAFFSGMSQQSAPEILDLRKKLEDSSQIIDQSVDIGSQQQIYLFSRPRKKRSEADSGYVHECLTKPIGHGQTSSVFSIFKIDSTTVSPRLPAIWPLPEMTMPQNRLRRKRDYVVKIMKLEKELGKVVGVYRGLSKAIRERNFILLAGQLHVKEILINESENSIFLLIEKARGKTLHCYLIKNPDLCMYKRLKLAIAILHAYQKYIYLQNIIHRDLKPENIMVFVDENGEYIVTIIDFGSAALANVNRYDIVGTCAYMPPEAFQTPNRAHYSYDLFSLGRILFETIANIYIDTLEFSWYESNTLIKDNCTAQANLKLNTCDISWQTKSNAYITLKYAVLYESRSLWMQPTVYAPYLSPIHKVMNPVLKAEISRCTGVDVDKNRQLSSFFSLLLKTQQNDPLARNTLNNGAAELIEALKNLLPQFSSDTTPFVQISNFSFYS